MLKVALSAIAFCSAVTMQSAMAADLPVAPAPAAAVFNWTGFYIGGHVGWGWGRSDSTILEATNNFFPQGTVNEVEFRGPLAGGQIGYNFQAGQWVFGVEAEAAWSGIKGHTSIAAILLANRRADNDTDVNWIAMVTGRFGYAAGPALFYVKGGWAWADFENSVNSINTVTGALLQTTSGGETRSGWTVGGGMEYSFGGNWSAKLEYNFIDLGTDRVDRTGTNFVLAQAVANQRDVESRLNIVKFGINYRFGATPVVARY